MTAQFDAEKFQHLCEALEKKTADLDKYLGNVKSVAGDATKLKEFIDGGEKQAKSINDIIARLTDMEQKAVDQVMLGKQAPNCSSRQIAENIETLIEPPCAIASPVIWVLLDGSCK